MNAEVIHRLEESFTDRVQSLAEATATAVVQKLSVAAIPGKGS
jgi:hypothetical protein